MGGIREPITVDEFERTRAGKVLFNVIGEMNLVNQQGHYAFFSRRREIARRFMGMLLEGGWVPEELAAVPTTGDADG